MLKKYTKYAATAFAVASLSTFMIGCADAVDETPPIDINKKIEGGKKAPGDKEKKSPPAGKGAPGGKKVDLPPTKS